MATNKTAPKTGTKPPAKKASGFQAEALAVFNECDNAAISAAAANTTGGGSSFNLPIGNGYLLTAAAEQKAPKKITPKDGGAPYPLFEWQLEVVAVPPGGDESLVGGTFGLPFFFQVRENDQGEPVCYDAAKARGIVEMAYGEEHNDPLVLVSKLAELAGGGLEFVVNVAPRKKGNGVNYYFEKVSQ